ncbi:MAG: GNAT superfamily N-acetyltransferase [Myxococcota bacterium]|jgi:GNAT superfamily N-acetyltransferase
MTLRIRPGTVADVPVVLELWTALMAGGSATDPRYRLADDARAAMWSYVRNDWLSGRYPFPALWVADGESVVGFVSITVVPANPVVAFAPTAQIGDLWVQPEHRRQGVGARLVNTARQAASEAGYRRHKVGTLIRDTRAVAFWENQGFTPLYVQLTAEPA